MKRDRDRYDYNRILQVKHVLDIRIT